MSAAANPASLSSFWGTGRGLLDDIPFVAFDTETTGLGEADRLVELGAVRFQGGQVEAEWASLVDPRVAIPPEATAVHGIGDADVRGCPGAAAVLPSFLGFIQGAALVAHNARFDVRVLAQELLHAGLPLPDNPVLDTCAIPRRLQVSVPDHRLTTLARTFHVRHGRAHRALEDARIAKGLLGAYLRDLGPAADCEVRRGLTEDGLLSFRAFASGPLPELPMVTVIRRAQAEGRSLSAVLAGEDGRRRRLTPRALYVLRDRVYLEAESHDDGRLRTFPLDRLMAARLD